MSSELAPRHDSTLGLRALDALKIGNTLARSGYFADAKQEAQAVVKVLKGLELGIGPVTAMTEVHIVQGKPALSATLIAALIKRSGRYDYRITAHTDRECVIEFFEKRADKWESSGTSSFTVEDAARAGLAIRETWQKFPRNMLFARALSNGARWYCADVFGGAVYTPEELGDLPPAAGDGSPSGVGPAPGSLPGPSTPRTETPAPEEPDHTPPAESRAAAMARFAAAFNKSGGTAQNLRDRLHALYGKTSLSDLTDEELGAVADEIEGLVLSTARAGAAP